MIAWDQILASGLWLTGLAGLLAVVSYQLSLGLPPRGAGAALAANGWAWLSGAVFGAGMALTSSAAGEALGWALLTAYAGYQAVRRGRRGAPAPAPAEPAAPPGAARAPLAEWIVRRELLWLALLAPFYLFPAGWGGLALLGLPALWLVRKRARGRGLPRTPLDGPLGVLLVMGLVSLCVSVDRGLSAGTLTRLVYGMGLYYAVVDWVTTDRRLRQAVGGYLILGGLLAGIGLLGTDWAEKSPLLSKLTAAVPGVLHRLATNAGGFNPNIVGGALLWVLLLQIALLGWAWTGRRAGPPGPGQQRLILLILAGGTTGTLVLTQSRNALISLAAGIGVLLALGGRGGRLVLAIGLLGALGATLYIGPQTVAARAADAYGSEFNLVDNTRSLEGRTVIWSRALYGLEDFSVTGMGADTFRQLLPIVYPISTAPAVAAIPHAHNQWLQAALDFGLPGLVAYLALWLSALGLAWQTWRQAGDGWYRTIAAGIGAGVVASALFGMTDAIALVAKPGIFFWGLLGLLVALWTRRGAPADAGQGGIT